MAFVGFWMIPLALVLGAISKICMFFGFDFMAWLGNPATMEKLMGYLEKIIVFIGRAWEFAEPYVSPVIDFVKEIL